MQIVYNPSGHGLRLSLRACRELDLPAGCSSAFDSDVDRTNPRLVQVIQELGDAASSGGPLRVLDVPEDAEWHIEAGPGGERVIARRVSWSAL